MKACPPIEERRDGILLSSDPARVDLAAVHAFLRDSYWSRGIPIETVARSIENSLCFGLYDTGAQVGFARLITDRATYAEPHQYSEGVVHVLVNGEVALRDGTPTDSLAGRVLRR